MRSLLAGANKEIINDALTHLLERAGDVYYEFEDYVPVREVTEKVRLLIEMGADVNIEYHERMRHVIGLKNSEILKLFIDAGANIHILNDALSQVIALYLGDAQEAIELLLDAGVDINKEGGGPLFDAVVLNRTLIPFLLEAGARPEQRPEILEECETIKDAIMLIESGAVLTKDTKFRVLQRGSFAEDKKGKEEEFISYSQSFITTSIPLRMFGELYFDQSTREAIISRTLQSLEDIDKLKTAFPRKPATMI
jgi:hypothetical protein